MIDSRCGFVPVDSPCSNPAAIAVDQVVLLLTALRSSFQELDRYHIQKSRISAVIEAPIVKCQVPFWEIAHGANPWTESVRGLFPFQQRSGWVSFESLRGKDCLRIGHVNRPRIR